MSGVFAHPFDLHRKGSDDQARHAEKLRDALKGKLHDLIADESIISSDPRGRTVRFPMRSLGQYRFRHGDGGGDRVAHGPGDGQLSPGDVVGRDSDKGKGQGPGEPGDGEGEDVYEVEIGLDELVAMMLEELALPNLEPKPATNVDVVEERYDEGSRRGSLSNLDRRRTIVQNMKRNAARNGRASVGGFSRDDLRFRTWRETRKPTTSAVVYAMMDTSGSMTNDHKFLARSFFYWMTQFLRSRYTTVEIVFIAHDTVARIVDEDHFFHRGSSGGTTCSSALALMEEHLRSHYDPSAWNVYGFHLSDGDNLTGDTEAYLAAARRLLGVCSLLGYGEVRLPNPWTSGRQSVLMEAVGGVSESNFVTTVIDGPKAVHPALKAFFTADPATELGVRG